MIGNGAKEDRTPDLSIANRMLYQLSYRPDVFDTPILYAMNQ